MEAYMIRREDLSKILKPVSWAVFWGLSASACVYHRAELPILAELTAAFCAYRSWKNITESWPLWLHGRYQYLLLKAAETPSEKFGKAGFASEKDIETAGLFDPNNGVPIGCFNGRPMFYSFTHALCVAPAGSGKSISIALPSKLHGYRVSDKAGHSEAASVVVTDIKGEIAAMTARMSETQHKHKVFYLNPDELFGFPNSCFNPLQMVIDDMAYPPMNQNALADAQELVHQLLPEPAEGDKNKFFRSGSRNMILTAMLFLAAENPACCTLPELFRTVSSAKRLKALLEEAANSTALSGDIALLASGLLDAEEDCFADFLTGALQVLMPFSPSTPLAQSVSKSDFTFEALKQEKTSVYIMSRYDRRAAYAPWIGLVTKAAIKSLIRTEGNVPVHFLLDEATNIPLPGLANDLTALRGYGLRCQFICQAKSEVSRIYGKEATQTFYSQTDLKQFFGVSSLEEAKEISDMLGNHTIKTHSFGTSATSPDADLKDSIAETTRALMRPEEVLRMPNTDQIILVGGVAPIYAERLPYNLVKSWHAALDENPLEGGKLPPNTQMNICYKEVH
jgi:type IV secretion system protein VirD4